MNALATPQTQADIGPSGGDGLNHLYCCDENLGLCGTDLGGHQETADDTTCVVCVELEASDRPCRPGCQDWSGGTTGAAA